MTRTKKYSFFMLIWLILNFLFIFNFNRGIQNTNILVLNTDVVDTQQTINNSSINSASNGFPDPKQYFPFGTNIVWGWIDDLADRQGIDNITWCTNALDDMQSHDINAIHFNNLWYDTDKVINLELFHDLAEERGIKLYPQAGSPAYYFPSWLGTKELRDQAWIDWDVPGSYGTLLPSYNESETILVWGLCEEIIPAQVPELVNWTELVAGLDQNHPGVVLYNNIDSVEDACSIIKPEIVPVDFYPFFANSEYGPNTTTTQLAWFESKINRSYYFAHDGPGSPVWLVAQGFREYSNASSKWIWRYPTVDEMHWEAWVSLINGAKGIFYWTYTSKVSDNSIDGLVDRNGNATEIWDEVPEVWDELEPLTGIIVDINRSENTIVDSSGEGIRARTFQRSTGSDRYVMIVNTNVTTNKTAEVVISTSKNIYDLTTLEQISSTDLYNTEFKPGRGNIYLIGFENDFEWYLGEYTDEGDDDDSSSSSSISYLVLATGSGKGKEIVGHYNINQTYMILSFVALFVILRIKPLLQNQK